MSARIVFRRTPPGGRVAEVGPLYVHLLPFKRDSDGCPLREWEATLDVLGFKFGMTGYVSTTKVQRDWPSLRKKLGL